MKRRAVDHAMVGGRVSLTVTHSVQQECYPLPMVWKRLQPEELSKSVSLSLRPCFDNNTLAESREYANTHMSELTGCRSTLRNRHCGWIDQEAPGQVIDAKNHLSHRGLPDDRPDRN